MKGSVLFKESWRIKKFSVQDKSNVTPIFSFFRNTFNENDFSLAKKEGQSETENRKKQQNRYLALYLY